MSNAKKMIGYGTFFLMASFLVLAFGTITGDISNAMSLSGSVDFAHLASKLGISLGTSGAVINMVSGGATAWSIISAVFGVTGAGLAVAGGIQGIKYVIKKRGEDAAAAW